MRWGRGLGALALALALAGTGCGQDEPSAPAKAPAGTGGKQAAAAAPGVRATGDPVRGRQIYMAQCVACHNRDPDQVGPIGPPVRGASPELLAAKVVDGTYPEGHHPQRDSQVMPPRPDLADTIPDLAAYLGSPPG